MNESTLPSLRLKRRSFLKSTGLAVAAAVTGSGGRDARASDHPRDPAALPSDLVSMVNILQGTDSTPVFSRGNTLPIAARPFGMAHWTLQSRAGNSWMFQPGERRIQGFRATHQLSPWLGDYGHAVFLPFSGNIKPEPGARASSFRPEESHLSPHSMRLRLLRYGIDAELIPTERCALLTASFSKADPGWLFDIPGDETALCQPDESSHSISFTSTKNQGGVPEGFATYYVLQFSEPWLKFELKALKGQSSGLVYFGGAARTIEVRVATSFISFEQARRNLTLELGTKSAETLRKEGATVWNELLGRIEINGGTLDQRRTFYSCLYRTLLFPRIWHEPAADGTMQHRSPYNGKVIPGMMFADHGYWDVYRAWYPLMTLLFPERLAEILQAWVNVYKEGGWLPQFPCPGYRACMTGSLIDSIFGDAAAKKLPGFDLATAYAGLKKHATERGNPDAGYGRRGLEEYLKYGFCPAGLVSQSAAETVDAAYGDFCIAQVALALGKRDDAEMFLKRSQNWRQLFDTKTGFLRGKTVAGQWLEPFDPITWGDPYVEGSAWQHRWDVPHDMDALFEGMGGKEKVVAALEQMVTMSSEFNVGSYGDEIHEMSEMAAVHFGQYAHSNQPVHHVLYLFAAAGRPDRTRFWVDKVMNELYTPDAFAGDEDTGSMAAWYIFSALGFYPLCPGKPEYTLGQAYFPSSTVHLGQGRSLHIEAAKPGQLTTKVLWNGRAVNASTLPHTELMAGGRLQFFS
ncbi:GH92 family glycosyl hydrolase [Granulicella sibirica]|uniref:Alpha-1,2-mannosidase n=1 Tax=Granulicella sibirica TaxID=2479048 RepID=A0A4Q0SW72_9BACT|nr:GH92 family glycosyl hydrolase [Granulicella sibirica]RXH54672.1 Alpha-1,2-mannosidase [Granulicella sibirica]